MFKRATTINTDEQAIRDILSRGIEDVFVKESLEAKLKSGKQLRIKLGIDPTSKNLHIGRAIPLWKLKAFQDLGHQIVLIVGDFTAQIGDASDKLQKRPMLTEEAVQENLKEYKKIIGKVIDVSKAEFVFNSKWLSKLTFKDVCQLAEAFSLQQMISRRNFKDRLDKGEEISLRELMYPLMQGYDSVAVKADVEIGGFDQLFNLKAGRIIQKYYGMPEQDIATFQMLEGTDGRKMSSSWGNVININDEPNDMYGKVMSVRDELLVKYFTLCTQISLEKIDAIKKELESGVNPKDIKMRLAREMVTMYYGKEKAEKAEENFVNTFKKGGIPDDAEEGEVRAGTLLVDLLLEKKIIASKSEWRRLIDEQAVSDMESNEKITDPFFKIEKKGVYKIGKRRFIKITVK